MVREDTCYRYSALSFYHTGVNPKMTDMVVLLFDGEDTAEKAKNKLIDLLREQAEK
jgi:hypothetical protein